MKKVLLIATGGTIACKVTENGLTPMMSSDELLSYVPAAKEFCTLDTCELMNIDSTCMHPTNWLMISKKVEECYPDYDGFVITHGTDTMAYTAAALSYLIQNSPKPIVVTGSQKPIGEDTTDARQNLFDSLRYACSGSAHGVNVVFGGRIISGTRAKKMNTKSYDAFSSINFPELGVIRDKGIIQFIDSSVKEEGPVFYHDMSSKVLTVKLIPGLNEEILRLTSDYYDAFILESYGVGGIPEGENYHFHEVLRELIAKGKTMILTTQATFEGSDITVYHSGHVAKAEYGIMEAYDMTMEATVTKLMWILGITKDPEKIKEMFYTTVSFDMLAQ